MSTFSIWNRKTGSSLFWGKQTLRTGTEGPHLSDVMGVSKSSERSCGLFPLVVVSSGERTFPPERRAGSKFSKWNSKPLIFTDHVALWLVTSAPPADDPAARRRRGGVQRLLSQREGQLRAGHGGGGEERRGPAGLGARRLHPGLRGAVLRGRALQPGHAGSGRPHR